jgi:hypothetical protein
MAKRSVLGLYTDENVVPATLDAVKAEVYGKNEYEVLTGTPYPEGTFGEEEPTHKLFRWPLIGALCGFIVSIVFTAGSQLAYPVVTGGKPILGIPPMAIITYEGTMLGAIIFTVIGIIFESRLPRMFMGAYDTRITEGFIGVAVTTEEDRLGTAEDVLKRLGAEDIKRG